MVEISDLVFDVDEVFKNAEPARGFNEVAEEIQKENYPYPAGYDYDMEQARTWNILANQCVGSEKY